jgi:molecular chaperone HscB
MAVATMQTDEQKSVSAVCWSCAATLNHARIVCGECGKVQPPSVVATYFEVFGLPRKLNIDLQALERDFYKLSRKLHPDVYARASEEEQEWSLANTSLLNDAYRTLKNPLTRTEYLLKLEGMKIGEEDAADHGKSQARVPADLLEEVFELNMQLDEMRANQQMGEDDPQLRHDLQAAKIEFESQLAGVDADLASLWNEWDSALDAHDKARAADLKEKMVALLDRRRYIRNLVRDVNQALGI